MFYFYKIHFLERSEKSWLWLKKLSLFSFHNYFQKKKKNTIEKNYNNFYKTREWRGAENRKRKRGTAIIDIDIDM